MLNKQTYLDQLTKVKQGYAQFLQSCQLGKAEYSYTFAGEPTPFALCFAIFGHHLLGNSAFLSENSELFARKIILSLEQHKNQREAVSDLSVDKSFLQLLTFSMSSLFLLSQIEALDVEKFVKPLVPKNIKEHLYRIGTFEGKATTGNLAMFVAVLLLHLKEYSGEDTSSQVDEWIDLHLKEMNAFGFWGPFPRMNFLQFQNGYHQYEIFEYLQIKPNLIARAAESTVLFCDPDGHFAPYPGGSGCYDYDALAMLTTTPELAIQYQSILMKTAQAIFSIQNLDGGFSESHYIRPRSLANFAKGARHVLSSPSGQKTFALKYAISLQHSRFDQFSTHWTKAGNAWADSDLWNSWFRTLALERVAHFVFSNNPEKKGFIQYPGLGFL